MTTPIQLKKQLMYYYLRMIREKKIKYIDIEKKLPYLVRDELLGLLIEEGRYNFRTQHYMDLKTELMISTAKNVEITEDMAFVDTGNGMDNEYVQDIEITFKEPRLMYALVEDPDPLLLEDPENIIMVSDLREDLETVAAQEDNIMEIFTERFPSIIQHQHPSWERIIKFVKNSLHDNYLEDEEEPYYEKYGDF